MSNNTHVIDREALRREGWQVIETEEEEDREEATTWLRSVGSPSPMNAQEWAAMAYLAGLRAERARQKIQLLDSLHHTSGPVLP